MHLIAYVSTVASKARIETSIGSIVATAKTENAKRGITGVLFYKDGRFLQVIEGEEKHLRQLMNNIERDKRHSEIYYLIDTPVETRGFSQWNMDAFTLDGDTTFDAATLKALTESFKANLVPRSDMLIFYYKVLLGQKSR